MSDDEEVPPSGVRGESTPPSESGPAPRPNIDRVLERQSSSSFFPPSDDESDEIQRSLDALRPSGRPRPKVGSGVNPSRPGNVAELPGDISRVMLAPEDELLPPSSPSGLLSRVLSRTDRSDPGALAARRSLPRLVAPDRASAPSGPSDARVRARRLEALAELEPHPATRANLIAAAAELHQGLGDATRARALYEAAHENEPGDAVVLRELIRDALSLGELERATEWLRREVALPLNNKERALSLTLLAELELSLGHYASAEDAAAQAIVEHPRGVTAGLLLAEARSALGKTREAAEAMRRVAEMWPDERTKAALLVDAGRLLSSCDEPIQALAMLERAQKTDADALEAQILTYRVARTNRRPEAALGALETLAAGLHDPALKSDARRIRAALLHVGLGDARVAAAELGDDKSSLAERTRVRALGDAPEREQAFARWAALSTGPERALALCEVAMACAARSDIGRAEQVLDAAEQAEPMLSMLHVVRDTLARYTRDSQVPRMSSRAPAESSLEAAARIAGKKASHAEELELLARARKSGGDGVTAEVLWLDSAAAHGLWRDVAELLRKRAEQGAPTERLAAWVALAELSRLRRIDGPASLEALARAEREASDSPVPTLGRLLDEQDDTRRGEAWLALWQRTEGALGAFAATCASSYLARAGRAREALDCALTREPGHAPAAWELLSILRKAGDSDALARTERALARTQADPLERAARLVRAALAGPPGDEAAALIADALALRPDDLCLGSIAARIGGPAGTLSAAEQFERDAALSPRGPRYGRMRAAGLLERSGEAARAAALYVETLRSGRGHDPMARAGAEHALITTGLEALWLSQLEQEVDDLTAPDEAVEDLARARQRAGAPQQVETWRAVLRRAPDDVAAWRALQCLGMQGGDATLTSEACANLARLTDDAAEASAELLMSLETTLDAAPTAMAALIGGLGARTDARHRVDEPALLRAGHPLWPIAREYAGRRAAAHEATLRGMAALCDGLHDADEVASYGTVAARVLERFDVAGARTLLERCTARAPHHSLSAEELGRLAAAEGDDEAAARAYEQAGNATESESRATRLMYRAAELWRGREPERERACLEAVAQRDIDHRDVFDRLCERLRAAQDSDALLRWIERRLDSETAKGTSQDALAALHAERARLLMSQGEHAHARKSLSDALASEPEKPETLLAVADLSLADGDWNEAAEALIRLARRSSDRAVLRDAFMKLGEIYQHHKPDARRAEIAYARVVALEPDNLDALEHLVEVYLGRGDNDKAKRALTRLLELTEDEARADAYHVRFANTLRAGGDVASAERHLEARRSDRPASRPLVDALSELYLAQDDQTTLTVHLDRAINSFREAVVARPSGADAWLGLCDNLERRGREQDAQAVMDIGRSLHVPGLPKPSASGGRPLRKLPQAAAVSRLLPAELGNDLWQFLLTLEPLADTLLPFDRNAVNCELLKEPVAGLDLERVQQRCEVDALILFAADIDDCIVIATDPLTLAVGRDLLDRLDARAMRFLLLRAAATARCGLWVGARARPHELAALFDALGELAEAQAELEPEPELEDALLSSAARALRAKLPQDQLAELARALAETNFRGRVDPHAVGRLCMTAGSQIALGAEPRFAAALRATIAVAPEPVAGEEYAARDAVAGQNLLAALRTVKAARDLLTFALSDAHLKGS